MIDPKIFIPSPRGYYETLGYMYMQKHRLKEARAMFEKYLSMNPFSTRTNLYMPVMCTLRS